MLHCAPFSRVGESGSYGQKLCSSGGIGGSYGRKLVPFCVCCGHYFQKFCYPSSRMGSSSSVAVSSDQGTFYLTVIQIRRGSQCPLNRTIFLGVRAYFSRGNDVSSSVAVSSDQETFYATAIQRGSHSPGLSSNTMIFSGVRASFSRGDDQRTSCRHRLLPYCQNIHHHQKSWRTY